MVADIDVPNHWLKSNQVIRIYEEKNLIIIVVCILQQKFTFTTATIYTLCYIYLIWFICFFFVFFFIIFFFYIFNVHRSWWMCNEGRMSRKKKSKRDKYVESTLDYFSFFLSFSKHDFILSTMVRHWRQSSKEPNFLVIPKSPGSVHEARLAWIRTKSCRIWSFQVRLDRRRKRIPSKERWTCHE